MPKAMLSLTGVLEAAPKTMLAPGNSYIGFACGQCGSGIALFDDPTGSANLSLGGEGRVRLTCPACGASQESAFANGRIFQAVNGGMVAPREEMSGLDRP